MNNETKKTEDNDNLSRTVIIAAICIPLIVWLLYTAYEKSKESPVKMAACEQSCTEQGYAGYDFKWSMFSSPQCTCLSQISN